jgi:hypothetical protein
MIMRIARVQITRFRGFESFVLLPREHVVVVGEPRAGRSDLVAALRRVLEPRSVLSRPSEWDVFRPLPTPPLPGDQEEETATPLTCIEISLLRGNDYFGMESEPMPVGSKLLYVVLTRARTKTIVLTLGSTLPSLIYPLAVLSAGS